MRTHVILPEELVKQIDAQIGKRQRSRFIEEAIKEKLARIDQAKALKKLVGILKDGNIPEYWSTPEKTSEWVHNLRYHPERAEAGVEAPTGVPGQ
jgi:metal-responsive CopG/Arc/MetJ family transcriptional regulator